MLKFFVESCKLFSIISFFLNQQKQLMRKKSQYDQKQKTKKFVLR